MALIDYTKKDFAMNYKKIELIISKDGTITERVINGDGKTCTDLTAGLEIALGEVASQELLPEYQNLEAEIQQDSGSWLFSNNLLDF